MSVRQGIAPLLAIAALLFAAGCSSNGNTITNPVPPSSGSFNNGTLNGTYVFSVSGTDNLGFAFAAVGTLTANGSGIITGGSLDINNSGSTTPIANALISGSSTYNVQVDGRGVATLKVTTPFANTLILDFVLASKSHGFVTEFDAFGSGSGTLDLQAAGATATGTYAFSFSGADSTGNALVTVGDFTLGTAGAITGTEDFNDNIIAYPNQTLTGQLNLGPSSTPSTTLTTTSGFGTQTFDVFAIDATHLKFIQMNAPPAALLSGDAFSQTSPTIAAGTMAFTLQGFVSGNPTALGGFMVMDGVGNITSSSTEDVNNAGSLSAPPSFTATYTAAGAGRFTLNNFSSFFGGTAYAAYPSTGGLLLLEIDNSNIMAGAAYPQSSTTFSTSQGYGLNLSGINLGAATGTQEEVDDIAEFSANATGTTVVGIVDENYAPSGVPIFDQSLNGTYVAPDSNGRGQLSANAGNSSSSTLNGGFALTFYAVDGTTFPFIETDGGQVTTGVFVLQNSSASGAGIVSQSHMFTMPPLIHPHALHQKKN
ncbi:MAG TPA: hypothetical protein VFE08_08905 [Candidatus Sulfotelmatobacter sp.]|jgi:hypothetical protein|nr:hypothetical protein [Candidatus Sulfotelmatobacter sp.]